MSDKKVLHINSAASRSFSGSQRYVSVGGLWYNRISACLHAYTMENVAHFLLFYFKVLSYYLPYWHCFHNKYNNECLWPGRWMDDGEVSRSSYQVAHTRVTHTAGPSSMSYHREKVKVKVKMAKENQRWLLIDLLIPNFTFDKLFTNFCSVCIGGHSTPQFNSPSGLKSGVPERVSISCSTYDPSRYTQINKPQINKLRWRTLIISIILYDKLQWQTDRHY